MYDISVTWSTCRHFNTYYVCVASNTCMHYNIVIRIHVFAEFYINTDWGWISILYPQVQWYLLLFSLCCFLQDIQTMQDTNKQIHYYIKISIFDRTWCVLGSNLKKEKLIHLYFITKYFIYFIAFCIVTMTAEKKSFLNSIGSG